MASCRFLLVLVVLAFAAGCAPSHAYLKQQQLEQLSDGVFTGEIHQGLYQAVVEVTVEDGRISAVEIQEVNAVGWRQAAVTEKFPGQVVEAQSVEVDAISGATGSYEALRIATDRALAKSVSLD